MGLRFRKSIQRCLIFALLFVAVAVISVGCSGETDETTQQPTLPEAQVSDRSFPAPETDSETTAPESEPSPVIVFPVITETQTDTAPPETEPAETPAPETEPVEATTPETEPPQLTTYCLNTSTKKIHRVGCSSVAKIKDENKSITTDYESYLAAGYTWCGICG